jgi:RNA polymerase sigma-70 factor (ECF subfamily)
MSERVTRTDEELVVRIRSKDPERYADLVKRYQDKLMRYACYLTKDEQVALDVVQESFIKAYVNLNGFDVRRKFSSWIYRIVHNEAMSAVRKNRKEVQFQSEPDVDSGVDLEHDYSKKEIAQQVRECLDGIPVEYSEPLILYYLEDKSYEEISDILRVPMGTVATRLNRGKARMKILCRKNS